MGSVTILHYRSIASNMVNVGLILPTSSLEGCANVGAVPILQNKLYQESRLTDVTLTLHSTSSSSE